MYRRCVFLIALLAAIIHGVGLARSNLPAQDGLKFLRVARQFSEKNWVDVVRGSDQHPLYPASIAVAHPLVVLCTGPGADSWRIAAASVSFIAAIALLFPLFGLARALFNEPIALIATLLFVLLPIPSELGHDTLSDSLALFFFVTSMRLGEISLRSARPFAAIGCGLVAGVGYLARPEVALVPVAVAIAGSLRFLPALANPRVRAKSSQLGAMTLALFFVVGAYATVKGEVSEKLAVRRFTAMSSKHDAPKKSQQPLPPGLDDPRWDFSAKEEFGDAPRLNFAEASVRLILRYAEAMGWFGALLAVWGAYRMRSSSGGLLIGVFVAVFAFVLVRHAMSLGYLSSRHTLSLVVATMPWAAAGMLDIVAMVRARFFLSSEGNGNLRRTVGILAMIALGLGIQFYRSPHSSRWGHGEAGRWLAAHSESSDKILDTRGWASFVSGRVGLDYWHVRQALVDPNLAFIVVGSDELKAPTRRADTLRNLLAFAANPVATFPDREGGSHADVQIYRYHRPADWSGMRP